MNILKKIVVIALLAMLGTAPCALGKTPDSVSIFFLESGSVDTPWTRAVREGFTEQLDDSGISYILHVDHLEAARFHEQRQYELMFRYLGEKFQDREPDIFVAAGPAASNFSTTHADLFPKSERILIHPGKAPSGHVIVVDELKEYPVIAREMLRLAAPEKVFIIGDSRTLSDKLRLRNISAALAKEGTPYEVLDNLPLPELLDTVSGLPPGNAVFFNPIFRKHAGRGLLPIQILKQLRAVSPCPLFADADVTLGFGTVGGYMYSARRLGAAAGEALTSQATGTFSRAVNSTSRYIYDWNEIVRWGFEDRLRSDAEILFREPSIWEQYKGQLFLAIFVFLTLSLLTAGLVITNSRLRRTRKSLRQERDHLEDRVRERTEELTRLHKAAEKSAGTDPLTGVSNRRHFTKIWEREFAVHQRHSRPLTVLMLDIDHFKVVNDTYGHTVGDKALVHFAQTSANQLRPADCIGRFGGEEFAVLLPDTDAIQARHVAERIRTTVQESTRKQGGDIPPITVSIGVADVRGETSLEQIIHRADAALYQAKQSGRNRVCAA